MGLVSSSQQKKGPASRGPLFVSFLRMHPAPQNPVAFTLFSSRSFHRAPDIARDFCPLDCPPLRPYNGTACSRKYNLAAAGKRSGRSAPGAEGANLVRSANPGESLRQKDPASEISGKSLPRDTDGASPPPRESQRGTRAKLSGPFTETHGSVPCVSCLNHHTFWALEETFA